MTERPSGGSEAGNVERGTAFERLAQQSRPQAMARLQRPLNAGGDMRINNPDKVKVQEALARRRRVMNNPFYLDGEDINVHLPPDDARYHYAMIRHSLNGNTDRTNLMSVLNGRLSYEPVELKDLDEASQIRFAPMMIKDGDFKGFVGLSDVVLMRCARRSYDMLIDAQQARADDQIMGTRSDFLAGLDRAGIGGEYDYGEQQEEVAWSENDKGT